MNTFQVITYYAEFLSDESYNDNSEIKLFREIMLLLGEEGVNRLVDTNLDYFFKEYRSEDFSNPDTFDSFMGSFHKGCRVADIFTNTCKNPRENGHLDMILYHFVGFSDVAYKVLKFVYNLKFYDYKDKIIESLNYESETYPMKFYPQTPDSDDNFSYEYVNFIYWGKSKQLGYRLTRDKK